jgi:hypothetical protein
MTTPHEPPASLDAEGEPDDAHAASDAASAVSAPENGSAPLPAAPPADGSDASADIGAGQELAGADGVSAEPAHEQTSVPIPPAPSIDGATADTAEIAGRDAISADSSADSAPDQESVDDVEEGADDDFDEVDAIDEDDADWVEVPFFRRWFSQRVIIAAGAVALAIVLITPMTFVAFGARGIGPLAARPTPTITPTATPTPPQKVVLQDPLTKRSSRWPEQQECSMREDGYHITANSICFLAGPPVKDSYITVTVAQTAGVEDLSYGITLRRADKGSYYSFEIDGSGHWYFYKAADSVLTLLASGAANPAIHKGRLQSNTLQVRATGQRFEFFVNDVKVGQVNDSSYAEGVIGLGGNDQLEVVYTNFILSQPA